MNYLENLKVLRQAVIDEPEHLFNLSAFEYESSCGTLHCTLGLACTMPHFQQQGLILADFGWPASRCTDGYIESTGEVAYRLFGNFPYPAGGRVDAYSALFEPAHDGFWDADLYEEGMTDRELALARLDHAISLMEQP